MSRPKVYIVQEPMKLDRVTNEWVPKIDLRPASIYGDLEVMVNHRKRAVAIAPVTAELQAKLARFSDDDCLLLVGDPVLIGIACVLAARVNNGRVKLLKWEGRLKGYVLIQLEV